MSAFLVGLPPAFGPGDSFRGHLLLTGRDRAALVTIEAAYG